MTDQEILTKAIEKAVANGWHDRFEYTFADNHPYEIIYAKDFAKALWGEELPYGLKYSDPPLVGNASHESEPVFEGAAWQYHLQQMVIADEPIAYLGGSLGLTLPPRLEVEPDGE